MIRLVGTVQDVRALGENHSFYPDGLDPECDRPWRCPANHGND
jgi:hypothetical protein